MWFITLEAIQILAEMNDEFEELLGTIQYGIKKIVNKNIGTYTF